MAKQKVKEESELVKLVFGEWNLPNEKEEEPEEEEKVDLSSLLRKES